jgi:hypothetical protein
MPEKRFALEPGGAERLAVSWKGSFKDFAIGFDEHLVASFEGPGALKRPQTLVLPDGSHLEVQLASPLGFPELQLRRDGEAVPGSSGDPAVRLQAAWGMVAFVAALNVVLGLLVELFDIGFLRAVGGGWGSFVSGLVYGVLAFFVRRRSLVALGLAVALFVVDGVLLLLGAAQAGGTPAVGGLVARVFFLLPMLRGFSAIRELDRPRPRRPQRRAAAGASPTAAAAGGSARTSTGPAPAAAADATGTQQPTTVAASRTLSGDAERRRLQMSAVAAATGSAKPVHSRKSISMRSSVAGVDEAAAALRFVARRCEIGPGGLRAFEPNGKLRDLAWTEIARVVARALPPDPPWDAALLLDLVAPLEGRWQPVRIFSSTLVNYAALPGGASAARIDNLRRFAAHVRERNPSAAVDDETAAFLAGGPVPRFPDITGFTEYDSVYG